MEIDEFTNEKYLDHGDVVSIEGEKYLCEEQNPDYSHCWHCYFKGYNGCRLPKELKYDCWVNNVAIIPIEKVIEREQKEIDKHKKYINYLKGL